MLNVWPDTSFGVSWTKGNVILGRLIDRKSPKVDGHAWIVYKSLRLRDRLEALLESYIIEKYEDMVIDVNYVVYFEDSHVFYLENGL